MRSPRRGPATRSASGACRSARPRPGAGVRVAATPVTLSGRSGGSPRAAGSAAGGTGLSASVTASAAGGEAPAAASTGSSEARAQASPPAAAWARRPSRSACRSPRCGRAGRNPRVSRWRTSRAVISRPGSSPSSHSPSCHTAPRRWSATSLSTALAARPAARRRAPAGVGCVPPPARPPGSPIAPGSGLRPCPARGRTRSRRARRRSRSHRRSGRPGRSRALPRRRR